MSMATPPTSYPGGIVVVIGVTAIGVERQYAELAGDSNAHIGSRAVD